MSNPNPFAALLQSAASLSRAIGAAKSTSDPNATKRAKGRAKSPECTPCAARARLEATRQRLGLDGRR